MLTGRVVFVVAGGELDGSEFFLKKITEASPAAVICADGGARHLEAAGVNPDLVIGDMDSIDPDVLRHYEESGCRVVRCPQSKDETDTELALQEAFCLEPSAVWIWGAMGGRIDHTLANISLLSRGIRLGIPVKLIDERCEVFMIARKTILDGEIGQVVSLLPVSQKATGITLGGFEYPLENGEMEIGHPYGVSNRLVRKRGIIEIASGLLLAIRYFRPEQFAEIKLPFSEGMG